MKWIKTSDQPPKDSRTVFIIFSGQLQNVTFTHVVSTANFFEKHGWYIDCISRPVDPNQIQVEWWAEVELPDEVKKEKVSSLIEISF